jgi:FkbM family methyltransferase
VVPLRTLDCYSLEDLSFVKIDVEGHEVEFLRGAAHLIRRERPHLLVEVGEKHLTEEPKTPIWSGL